MILCRRVRSLLPLAILVAGPGAGVCAIPLRDALAAETRLFAQDTPPGDIPDQDTSDPAVPNPSAMLVRVTRLENQIRTLTGRIEELQHQNATLEDNLRKLGQDVDFRFRDLGGRGTGVVPARPAVPHADAEADGIETGGAAVASVDPMLPPAPAAPSPATPKPARPAGGDAFDPNADPGAPGAPKLLGTTSPSPPLARPRPANDPAPVGLARPPGAPLDLTRRPVALPGADDPSLADVPGVIPAPAEARATPNPNAVASLMPGGTRDEYDADVTLFKQGQFDGAATGFQSFVDRYPRDRLVPDAVYLLGESYSRLGRHREAAEQFLKVSTDYAKSSRAPDSLLRLGMSLNALGAREQACATLQEVNRKYPAASPEVRTAVDRELKRTRCQPS